jgi:hypothetical protein
VEQTEQSVEQFVFGDGPSNYTPRHNVFKGFETNSEFQEMLGTLMDWKLEAQPELLGEGDIAELEQSMAAVISQAIELKEFQKDNAAAIESLRSQYGMLLEA